MRSGYLLGVLNVLVFILFGCEHKSIDYYSVADFGKVSKIDAHFHYFTPDIRYLEFADSLNFKLISPNVNIGMSIDDQYEISGSLKERFPDKFSFLCTFSVDSFSRTGFANQAIAHIDKCIKGGASGVKIWKNIGMVLKDRDGRFVMVNDHAFEPIFKYLQKKNIPVLAHLGEPRNCWLPLEEMTLDDDRRYYKSHPQYHMFLHPETPSYDDQIIARDNILKQFPDLHLAGAHLASLEWNVDELGKRFDQFPNLKADLSARMGHLQFQSQINRERVRNFLIKYQDRILYGTDVTLKGIDTNYTQTTSLIRQKWMDHWIYLATDSTIVIKDIGQKEVKGLKLPRSVIDKIYFKNAESFFCKGKL